MRPKVYGKPLPDGSRRFNYICTRKLDSRGALCSSSNAPGHDVDAIVLKHLRGLSGDGQLFGSNVPGHLSATSVQDVPAAIKRLEAELVELQRKLDNVTDTIAEGVPASARPKLFQRMEQLDDEIQAKQKAIADLNDTAMAEHGKQDLLNYMQSLLNSFSDTFDVLSHDEKRRLLRTVVDGVTWDGKTITIDIFGEKTLPK